MGRGGFVAIALAAAAVATVGAQAPARVAPRLYDGGRPSVAELSALGRLAFDERGLSASGRMACSTCHDPRRAFGPGPGSPSPFADGDPAHAGRRAIPSLRYTQFMPRFSEHYVEDDEDQHGADAGPTGGLTWDGRRDTAHEQARIPLFAPDEMANADDAALAARVARTAWAGRFRAAFSAPGADVFDDPGRVVAWLALSLEVYEQEPEFAPFTSRWDRVLAGEATLTPSEKRGYEAYEDPARGNCESCHPSARMARGAAPLFTDAGFNAIAAPRRAGLPLPRTLADYDLGLCMSGREGLANDPGYCGRFRTPSLRNVAVRPSFFHNGSLHSLRDAVAFYATRDADPARWYPKDDDGSVRLYDDLPAAYKPYVDREIPFLPRPDGRPRLSDGDIDDIVAFLRTLTDADVEAAQKAPAG